MVDVDMNPKRSLRPENIAKLQEQLVIEEVSLTLATCRFSGNTRRTRHIRHTRHTIYPPPLAYRL